MHYIKYKISSVLKWLFYYIFHLGYFRVMSQLYFGSMNIYLVPVLNFSEKAMAPHSSTFAWKIPWMEEPGRLQSLGSLESDTTEWLNFHFSLSCIGEEMETHSSVLACRIPGMGEPGGLLSMGSHRVGHNWSDLAAAAAAGDSNEWPMLRSAESDSEVNRWGIPRDKGLGTSTSSFQRDFLDIT